MYSCTVDYLLYNKSLVEVLWLYDNGYEWEDHKAQMIIGNLAMALSGKEKKGKTSREEKEAIILKYGTDKQKEAIKAKRARMDE